MRVRTAGIDIGSRTVKVAIVEGGELVYSHVTANSYDPIDVCRKMLQGLDYHSITATGYGRRLFNQYMDCPVITEIRAVSLGIRHIHPECRTILDIGGQDTKVIALDQKGAVKKFEMNDKCAAGTGRFLEVMASTLSYTMSDFIENAQNALESHKISSMCTVFAESEVISLLARNIPREKLARGIQQSISLRTASMLKRISIEDDILFCGGVALNQCVRIEVEKSLGKTIQVPDQPQILAALGCALHNM
jgi:(R)-2-hydroxyacyl-CoA dehydratese activating ATPase